MHGNALGQFQLQGGGGNVGLLQDAPHQLWQLGLVELDGRQVDRHFQVREACLVPGLQLRNGILEDPFPDLQNLATVFGHRNEFGRGNGAQLGLLPAQQGFDAAYLPGVQADLRLVVQGELIALQRPAHGVFQLQGAHRFGMHLRREEAVGVAPLQFCVVHRDIGRLRQAVDVLPILRKQRDAHGGGHAEFVVADLVGLARGFLQLPGHAGRALGIGAGQQQHELIAAQAGHGVFFAHHGPQALGDLLEQGVAHLVAQRVIDVLEAVQVQKDHCQGAAVGLGRGDCGLAALCQQCPVGQAGQRVVVRHPVDALLHPLAVFHLLVQGLDGDAELVGAFVHQAFQLGLRLCEDGLDVLAFGDVHQDPDFALAVVQRVHPAAACLAFDELPLLVAQGDFPFEVAVAAGGDLAQDFQGRGGMAQGRRHIRELDQLFGLVAQHAGQVRVAAAGGAAAPVHDADGRGLEQQLLLAQGGGQQGLAAAFFIDVVNDPDGAFLRGRRVDEVAGQAGPEQVPAAASQPAFGLEGFSIDEAVYGGTPQGLEIFPRGMQGGAADADRLLRVRKAKNLGEMVVATGHHAVLDEGNADARAVQQGLLLAQ